MTLKHASTLALCDAHKRLDGLGASKDGSRPTARLLGKYWTKLQLRDEITRRACQDEDPGAHSYAQERLWEIPRMPTVCARPLPDLAMVDPTGLEQAMFPSSERQLLAAD